MPLQVTCILLMDIYGWFVQLGGPLALSPQRYPCKRTPIGGLAGEMWILEKFSNQDLPCAKTSHLAGPGSEFKEPSSFLPIVS